MRKSVTTDVAHSQKILCFKYEDWKFDPSADGWY